MTELLIHYMAPLMFVGLIVFMVIGYPAAFSLAAVGLFFGLVAIGIGACLYLFGGKGVVHSSSPAVRN